MFFCATLKQTEVITFIDCHRTELEVYNIRWTMTYTYSDQTTSWSHTWARSPSYLYSHTNSALPNFCITSWIPFVGWASIGFSGMPRQTPIQLSVIPYRPFVLGIFFTFWGQARPQDSLEQGCLSILHSNSNSECNAESKTKEVNVTRLTREMIWKFDQSTQVTYELKK